MDNQLIDTTLQQLLATPHEQRISDRVIAALTLAAEAADGTLNAATPMEQELNTLHGALAVMAAEHGMQASSCLQNYPIAGRSLYGSLRLGELHVGAFGETAAAVLASIRQRLDSAEAEHE